MSHSRPRPNSSRPNAPPPPPRWRPLSAVSSLGSSKATIRTGSSEKALLEAAIVRRREMEDHRVDYWAQAKRYYDQMERRNGRHEAWTLTHSRDDVDGRCAAEQREERRGKLLVRRERLRQMLEKERQGYQDELRRMVKHRQGEDGDIVELRIVREEMRKAREEEMKKEAEEKMKQHFKINNPEFRELQFKKHREIVQKAWDDQRAELAAKREKEAEEERERTKKQMEKDLLREELERERRERREADIEEWKEAVLKQILELKSRKEMEIKLEERRLEEEANKRKVEEIENRRRRMEERRKNLDASHYLQRQHKLRLRAKAAEIKKELEDDRRTMEELQRLEEARKEDDELNRERRQRELQWMSKVLSDQKEVERRRARQMEFMFTEEAESTWEKQERLWEEEKRARKVLMDDVVGSWKKQIQDKVEEAKDRQRALESERHRLEKDIERLNGQIEEEERRNREEKKKREEEMICERSLRRMQQADVERALKGEIDGNLVGDNELADKVAKWNLDQEPLGVSYLRVHVR